VQLTSRSTGSPINPAPGDLGVGYRWTHSRISGKGGHSGERRASCSTVDAAVEGDLSKFPPKLVADEHQFGLKRLVGRKRGPGSALDNGQN
jgi:hypothetical protein